MAVTNAAASGIEGWVRRLVESERKVAVLETNQRDLGKAVGQTASDLSWEVDQWNNSRRFDNASSQVSTLNNWWTAKKNAVYGFDKLAMPAEAVDLQGLAALAAEETHSDGEKAVKSQLLASQQRLLELSAKQKDLRSAVDSLRGSANGIGSNAILAIRPEYMSIASEAAAGENGITATATNSTYLGAATRLDLTTRQGAKVTVSVPNEVAAAALSKGNSVWLTWPAEKGFLLPDGGR